MGRPSLLLLCLFSVSCLAEDNSHVLPVYKFGILAGEPTSLNGSTQAQVASFDECVDKCSDDSECIVASRDDGPCYLFKYDTITGVRKNESGGQGLVAFRVYTDQPSCDLNLPLLLNGKTYPLNANNTKENLWRIDTSEDGWTITYIHELEGDNLICGNWTYNRPYADGCNPECLLTMTAVYGEPGPLARSTHDFGVKSDWNACMAACHTELYCITVYWNENEKSCTYHTIYEQPYFVNKTSAEDGKHAAIKMNLNSQTCKLSTDQLLNGTYFMAKQDVVKMMFDKAAARVNSDTPTSPFMPFWRVRTTENYYLLDFLMNETVENTLGGNGCSAYWETADFDHTQVVPKQFVCYQPFKLAGVTQPDAKRLCGLMNGRLMVETYSNWMSDYDGFFRWTNPGLSVSWGLGCSNCDVWFGLERDEECVGADQTTSYCKGNQQWQWSNPSWPVMWTTKTVGPLPVDWKWAVGEPQLADDKLCAYFKIAGGYASNATFYTTQCDSTQMGGFVCAQETQQVQGVPKYDDVARSYGYI
ncbi:unnamed protein product [Caenorhabditis sp. 36 PRJEB53466]|nr:unnamed protein product [Caenorhabditis sp. 36 PRJEB53466]